MSVLQEITLPAQPAAGTLQYIPLGGDGWGSPQSAFFLNMVITGDATGGFTRWRINRDPRFEHILQFMSIESTSATAIAYNFDIFRGAHAPTGVGVHQVGTTAHSAVSGNVLANQMWTPPPIIDPIKFECKVNNVDTQEDKFKILVYNFNIRASELVPINIMLASLPRAASAL